MGVCYCDKTPIFFKKYEKLFVKRVAFVGVICKDDLTFKKGT